MAISVVAGILYNAQGQVLMAQRPPDKIHAGYWEFPGGKIEPGETARQALSRELAEELGIRVKTAYPWLTRSITTPSTDIQLHFFKVVAWQGTCQGKEGQALCWQSPDYIQVSPLLPTNQAILNALQLPPIYAISHLQALGLPRFLQALQQAVNQGLQLLQIREKQLAYPDIEALVQTIRHQIIPVQQPLKILVHHPHCQIIAGTDGLHLTAAQLMSLAARPATPWCSAACHNAAELAKAAQIGVDCVLLSPVLATATHPQAPPLGWTAFSQLIQHYPLPVYALGGMQLAHLPLAWQHGAQGIALLRAIWNAPENEPEQDYSKQFRYNSVSLL